MPCKPSGHGLTRLDILNPGLGNNLYGNQSRYFEAPESEMQARNTPALAPREAKYKAYSWKPVTQQCHDGFRMGLNLLHLHVGFQSEQTPATIDTRPVSLSPNSRKDGCPCHSLTTVANPESTHIATDSNAYIMHIGIYNV